MRRAFSRSLGSIAVVMTPAAVFVCAGAGPLTDVLLGAQWTGVVPLIVAFGISLPFRSAQRICSAALRAVGRSWLVAALQLLLLAATVLGSWFGIQYGLVGAAVGVTAAFLVHYLALVVACAIVLRMDIGTIARHHLSGVPLGILVAMGTFGGLMLGRFTTHFITVPLMMLIACLLAGAAAWLLPDHILRPDGKWLVNLLGARLPRRIRSVKPVSIFLQRVSQ